MKSFAYLQNHPYLCAWLQMVIAFTSQSKRSICSYCRMGFFVVHTLGYLAVAYT